MAINREAMMQAHLKLQEKIKALQEKDKELTEKIQNSDRNEVYEVVQEYHFTPDELREFIKKHKAGNVPAEQSQEKRSNAENEKH